MQEGMTEYPTEDSVKGTFLHEISAECLEFGLDPFDFVGRSRIIDGFRCVMDDTDAQQMQAGLDKIAELGLERLYVEKRVSMEEWSEGDFGTLDIGGWTKKVIVVADWKWGAGELVELENNLQFMIYALCFWFYIARHHTKARLFRLIKMQPKAGEPWVEWEITLDDLLEFAEELRKRAAATRAPDAKLRAGSKQCRWCRAKINCAEHARYCLKLLGLGLDVLDEEEPWVMPDPNRLTQEQRIRVYENQATVKRWLREIESSLLSDYMDGKDVPGMKAVQGRGGHRAWTNLKRVTDILRVQIGRKAFTKKLKTPAQVEELIGKHEFKALLGRFTEQPPGGPVLVKESDKRPAIVPAASMFTDEREEA